MQWAFAKANINIGRSTYDQINAGVEVSINNIQPGDLLFDSNLGHVAMSVSYTHLFFYHIRGRI